MKKFRNISVILLLVWIAFAQGCMFFRISDQKAAASFTEKGVAAKVVYQPAGNGMLHYVQTGGDTLPTLFFIHGSPGSWDAFKSYLEDAALRSRYRMISIDRPGFGYSSFGDAVNLDEQSKMISQVLKTVQNNRPVYLVGHSLGGPLCIRLALDNKGTLSGLVLLAAAIDPGLEKPEKWRLLLMHNPLQYLVPGAMRPSNYELWYLKADLLKMKSELPDPRLPFTWMVHGDKDMMVPYENVAFARKYLDSSKLEVITIKGANHFIPWSHFEIIKSLLLRLP